MNNKFKKCEHCNSYNQSDVLYCGKCGAKFTDQLETSNDETITS